jgi:hypothetical protein
MSLIVQAYDKYGGVACSHTASLPVMPSGTTEFLDFSLLYAPTAHADANQRRATTWGDDHSHRCFRNDKSRNEEQHFECNFTLHERKRSRVPVPGTTFLKCGTLGHSRSQVTKGMTGIKVGGNLLPISVSVFSVSGALVDSDMVITHMPPSVY